MLMMYAPSESVGSSAITLAWTKRRAPQHISRGHHWALGQAGSKQPHELHCCSSRHGGGAAYEQLPSVGEAAGRQAGIPQRTAPASSLSCIGAVLLVQSESPC